MRPQVLHALVGAGRAGDEQLPAWDRRPADRHRGLRGPRVAVVPGLVDRQRTPTLTHWVTSVNGMKREFDAAVTEQIPDERVAWTTVEGEVRQAGVVTFHRLDDGRCKIMLPLDHDPQGIADTVGDKLGFVRRQAKGDLTRFKKFIESRGTATGAWRGEV
ncbi:SRPBCC family protein [Embleya sp. NPDC008237]|uniref:SRPBCC family protein n=1 Tax=Embleya sp. NPDC008237 TaxID=3363978 RepID=UPI0036EA4D24